MSLRERIATHEAAHCLVAITYGIPILSVTVDDAPHLHRGACPAAQPCAFEALTVLCFAGIAAEELFCGKIEDGGDLPDLQMAREHVTRAIADPLQVELELARCKTAAARLVRSQFGATRIRLLADALLHNGSLSAQEIYEVAAAPASARLLIG